MKKIPSIILLFVLIVSGLVFGCNSDNQTESNKEEIVEQNEKTITTITMCSFDWKCSIR